MNMSFSNFKTKLKNKFSYIRENFSDGLKKFKALVSVQVRDKIDTSWTKQKKTRIQQTVFFILKFVLIIVAIFAVLSVIRQIFKVKEEILNYYLFFLGVFTILNLLTVTFGLMKSLYYAEDNKVLVTYPVSSGKLFLSKILVYFIFELKKDIDFILPITLGFLITGFMFGIIPIYTIFWSILPLILISAVTVLLGALLSIPTLFIYKFIKRFPIIGIIFALAIAGGAIYGLIYVINLIPVNSGDIDIVKQFPAIRNAINGFLVGFSSYIYPITYAFGAMVGETGATFAGYRITGVTIGRYFIVLGIAFVLLLIVYFVIKPFFFTMMTKTFEFDKKTINKEKKNKQKNKNFAFVLKELKLVFRDVEISGSYLCVYVLTPILLLFINRIFMAMDTSKSGNLMVIAINILLIILPLLASSTIVSTVYSREGRAAYIKKTKPVKPYFPLFSKLFFNLVLCVPSIVGCGIVFSQFINTSPFVVVALCLIVISLQYGHIFMSASLDIMNPQNEVYATEGSSISNPNERKSTFIAFLIAVVFTLISYVLIKESFDNTAKYDLAFVKLLILSLAFAGSTFALMIYKIKAFYIDRQEATRE